MAGAEERDGPLIGRSAVMRALLHRIARVAPTEATVLILGERGTGKELVARAVVSGSARRGRPFVPVNCAALAAELLASELFGHERGAFTGAIERRAGVLAAAAGGTVFLDEVGDLSAAGQAMLLRFLQQREVRPLGATQPLRVDVRVVAATNKDLARATREGDFRADLHDRLSEVALEVPPLRDRREDIALLVAHFLEAQSRRHGVPVTGIAPGALRLLEGYGWPGNVRELETAISRAVIFSERGWIGIGDLDLPAPREPGACGAAVARDPGAGRERRSLSAPLTARQHEMLDLAACRGVLRRYDVTARFRISGETVRRDFLTLTRLGLLRRTGARGGARYLPA